MCPGGFSSMDQPKKRKHYIYIAGLTRAPGRTKEWKNPSKIHSRFPNTWYQWKGGEETGDTVPSPSLWVWNHNTECKPHWAVWLSHRLQLILHRSRYIQPTQSKQTYQGLRQVCLNASALTTCHVKSAGSALTTLGLWWRFQGTGTVGAHT